METLFGTPIICPVLIGRRTELTALRLLVDRASSGKGQIVLLSGEAGIGKSRLVAEAKSYATARGFLPLQGQCFPTDRSCPYAPLLDLLRTHLATSSREQVATEMGSLAPALYPLLPDLLPLPSDLSPLSPLDPEQEKRRLFAALAHLFLRQATNQPRMLIVEDLHWSDETSLDFLHYLGRRCSDSPLLILLTYRSDEVHPGLSHFLAQLDRERLAQECALAPLSRSDMSAMLHAIFNLGRSVFTMPPLTQGGLLDALYALTEGNPFFVEELLNSIIEAGDIIYEHGRWERKELGEWHIPRSVQDAVQLRADQLSASARQVLLLAAVAGRRFDFAVLQQITHSDEQQLLPLMKELMAAQLVVEESTDQFAFRHALTRQSIYAELLGRERKTMHRAIAETMEHLYQTSLEAHLEDLASHFYEAGVFEKALEYAQRAGEKAQRLYASRASIEEYTRALDAARHLAFAASPTIYRARGQAYEMLGEFEQALRDYEQALEVASQADDGAAEWQSVIDLGFLWAGRDYERTGAYFRRATEIARALADPKLLAHSLNRLGNWHLNAEQPLEALRYHQEALSTFQEVHDKHGVAETLDLLGVTNFMGCDLLQGHTYYDQAIRLFSDRDDRPGLLSALSIQLMCGENYFTETCVPVTISLDEVLSQGERALKLAREIGQRHGEAFSCLSLAICLGSRGDYQHALDLTQQGLEITQEIEHRQWMTFAHWLLGVLHRDLLALPLASQHLEQALALAQEIGSLAWIHYASASLASLLLMSHDLAQAESLLNAALGPDDPAQTIGQRLVWAARADLALAQRKPERAVTIIEQLLTTAVNRIDERSIPYLSHMRGEALLMLRQFEEAESTLQAAQAGATTQGIQRLLWRISIDLGRLYQVQRRDEEAKHAFAAAQELIENLAVSISDTSLRDHFLHEASVLIPRQEPLSPRRAAKKAFGGLTEREREVAALIAQGKSNREIAEILVVNYRTIEKHIENILSKLGFASRAQIAVWAAEKGLGKNE
jgi:tetratricopeptide (TPR) repeat protein